MGTTREQAIKVEDKNLFSSSSVLLLGVFLYKQLDVVLDFVMKQKKNQKLVALWSIELIFMTDCFKLQLSIFKGVLWLILLSQRLLSLVHFVRTFGEEFE